MKTWHWLAIGAGSLAVLSIINKNKIMTAVWDTVTEARIQKLHPSIRERVRKFIMEADRQGMKLRITSGLRDFAEQAKLYAQGRTDPGNIVTNAKPGSSFHNYGLAIDVVEIKDGKGLWENPNWSKIGALGKSFGFAWGGDWTSLKDLPHFEYPPGKSASQLLAMYNTGKKDSSGYLTQIA
jgi:peptidoglycan LD-endopeptidase CwlK